MSRLPFVVALFALLGALVVPVMAHAQGGPIIIPRAPETIGRVPGAPAPPPAITPEMSIECAVAGLAAFQNRVHIRCAAPDAACTPGAVCPLRNGNPVNPRIIYYATEKSVGQNALAATAMTIAAEARRSNKLLRVWFRSSAAENPAGCLSHDCRRFVAVAMD